MDQALQIIKRVRRIELKARRQASGDLTGQYHSSFRGQGLDFDDFREYLPGDEPRFIDWKVTARTGTPHVRKFREDREMCVVLVVDATASMNYGSRDRVSKREYAAEIAAALAVSANRNGDRIGLLLTGETPGLLVQPDKAPRQTLRIVREILASPTLPGPVNFENTANFLLRTLKKRALVILVGDFGDTPDKRAIGKLGFRHELVALRIQDPAELSPPEAGRVVLQDMESGKLLEVDLSQPHIRKAYGFSLARHNEVWDKTLLELGIDCTTFNTSEDYLHQLQQLFQRRTRRHLV